MGEVCFISPSHALSHPGPLSCMTNMTGGSRASVPLPPTSDYPELTTPYSAVSSFNFPTRADPSLLTPVSAARSPALQPCHKYPGHYAPPGAHRAPEGTPPSTARMYGWQGQMDMSGQTSQTNSPMPHPAPVSHEFLTHSYHYDNRRVTPGPPEPYTGSYGVSESQDAHGLQQHDVSYYMGMHPEQMLVRDNQPMRIEPDREASGPHIGSAPMLANPQPPSLQPGRRPNGDGAMFHGAASDLPRPKESHVARRRQTFPRVRRHKSAPRKGSQTQSPPRDSDPADEHKNCKGEEKPPQLKDNCPPEERCIFEARWKHRDKKGQDMWESIQAEFQQQFNKSNNNKEMLQMKFKRGRSKYYQWLPEDEDILRQAFEDIERSRYEIILDKFYELGGSRNMQLSAGDVEVKMVNDLKLEEGFYMETSTGPSIRRRRKINSRKRQGQRGDDGELGFNDEIASVGSHNTMNEEDVINQVHGRHDVQPWSESAQMAIKMEPGFVSEKIARQQHDANRFAGHYGPPKGV